MEYDENTSPVVENITSVAADDKSPNELERVNGIQNAGIDEDKNDLKNASENIKKEEEKVPNNENNVTNEQSVDKQINIGKIEGDIKIDYVDEKKDEIDEDALSKLSVKIDEYPNPEDLIPIIKTLKVKRVISIYNPSDKLRHSAIANIVKGLDGSYDRRIITLEEKFSDQFFRKNAKKIGRKQDLVFIVTIDNETEVYYRNVFNLQSIERSSFFDYLYTNDIYIINEITNRDIQDRFPLDKKNTFVTHFQLDLVKSFLNKKYQKNIANLLFSDIKDQRAKGVIWSENDENFYEEVMSGLALGKTIFYNHVKNANKYDNQIAYLEDIRKKEAQPEKILDEDRLQEEPLNIYVAYVATFLPKLNLPDFKTVLDFLLEGETHTKYIQEKIEDEEGNIKVITTPKKIQLSDLWKDETLADKTLRRCAIQNIIDDLDEGEEYLNFSEIHLRDAFRRYFNQHHIFFQKRLFEKLFNNNIKKHLIFQNDTSPKLRKQLRIFYTKRAKKNPKQYTLYSFVGYSKGERKDDLIQEHISSQFLAKTANNRIHHLYELIYEMWKEPNLQKEVSGFIRQLISAFTNVMDNKVTENVLKRIRPLTGFDIYPQIKHFINKNHTSLDSFQLLLNFINYSSTDVYGFLEQITEWQKYSDNIRDEALQVISHSFIIDYILSLGLSSGKYKKSPSKYPLFSNVEEYQLRKLIQWLYARGLPKAYYSPIRKAYSIPMNMNIAECRLAIIDEWYQILLGSRYEVNNDYISIFSILIDELKKRATDREYEILKAYFIKKCTKVKNEYIQKLNYSIEVPTEKRDFIRIRKKSQALKKLQSTYQNLQTLINQSFI